MLKQSQADALLALLKKLVKLDTIDFPSSGNFLVLDVLDLEEREAFLLDVQRRGKIKLTKCTYQKRYQSVEVLLRLDVDGPDHENPDGEVVPCPHLHVYQEGYADKWAFPLPNGQFSNTTDLVVTLRDFLKYCKIERLPEIQRPVL